MNVTLKIDGRPVGKQRPRVTKSGHAFTPKKTRKYEKRVGWMAKRSKPHGWPMDAYYQLRVEAVYPNHQVADGDNIHKAIRDGLEGVLYNNDIRVRKTATEVVTDPDCGNGYVRVQVLVLNKSDCER